MDAEPKGSDWVHFKAGPSRRLQGATSGCLEASLSQSIGEPNASTTIIIEGNSVCCRWMYLSSVNSRVQVECNIKTDPITVLPTATSGHFIWTTIL